MVGRDRALAQWKKNVAWLGERRLPPVDVQPRATHGGGIQLARRRNAGADGVDVRAWMEPVPLEDRHRRRRRRADDRCPLDGSPGRRTDFRVQIESLSRNLRERAGVLGRSTPDAHTADGPNDGHRLHVHPALRAGPQNRQILSVLARQQARRDRRYGRRTNRRHRRRIENRE